MPPIAAYMAIRRYVMDLMRKHAEHDVPIMSERELCEKFGVTRPTVRRALKELIAEGYLTSRQGSGTFINPGKVMNHVFLLRKSFTVMVIIGGGVQVDLDGFFLGIMEQICRFFKTLPVNMCFVNIDTANHAEALRELETYNVDGVLWVRPGAHCAPIIASARERWPVCVLDNVEQRQSFQVTVDYFNSGRMAANWFLERNLQQVAFVGGTEDQSIKGLFYNGWRAAFAEKGLKYDQNLYVKMECNICQKICDLVSGGLIDGIFSFGSEFAAVDIALADMCVPVDRYPIMIDDNYYGDFGARIKPTVKIMFALEEMATLASEKLFEALCHPGYQFDEIVLQGKIRECVSHKKQKESVSTC